MCIISTPYTVNVDYWSQSVRCGRSTLANSNHGVYALKDKRDDKAKCTWITLLNLSRRKRRIICLSFIHSCSSGAAWMSLSHLKTKFFVMKYLTLSSLHIKSRNLDERAARDH